MCVCHWRCDKWAFHGGLEMLERPQLDPHDMTHRWFSSPGGTPEAVSLVNYIYPAFASTSKMLQHSEPPPGRRSNTVFQKEIWTMALDGRLLEFGMFFNRHVYKDGSDPRPPQHLQLPMEPSFFCLQGRQIRTWEKLNSLMEIRKNLWSLLVHMNKVTLYHCMLHNAVLFF